MSHKDFQMQEGDDSLVAQLPEQFRRVLRATGSYAERAEALGLPVGTVRSQLHRARTKLIELRNKRAA